MLAVTQHTARPDRAFTPRLNVRSFVGSGSIIIYDFLKYFFFRMMAFVHIPHVAQCLRLDMIVIPGKDTLLKLLRYVHKYKA
jgi:hypothetical protein